MLASSIKWRFLFVFLFFAERIKIIFEKLAVALIRRMKEVGLVNAQAIHVTASKSQ